MTVTRHRLAGVRLFWRQTRGQWSFRDRFVVGAHLLVRGEWVKS